MIWFLVLLFNVWLMGSCFMLVLWFCRKFWFCCSLILLLSWLMCVFVLSVIGLVWFRFCLDSIWLCNGIFILRVSLICSFLNNCRKLFGLVKCCCFCVVWVCVLSMLLSWLWKMVICSVLIFWKVLKVIRMLMVIVRLLRVGVRLVCCGWVFEWSWWN